MMCDEHGRSLPLSAGQMDLWIAHHLDTTGCVYNIGGYSSIEGSVTMELLGTALECLLAETDTLRVRFIPSLQGIRQVIDRKTARELVFVDLTSEHRPERAARVWMRDDMMRPVDLLAGPLFRFALLKVAEHRFFLHQRVHHVAIDGFGSIIVLHRLAELYTALSRGDTSPERRFGSLRAVIEQGTAYRASEQFLRDREYWSTQLAGWPEPITLSASNRASAAGDCVATLNSERYLTGEDSELLLCRARTICAPWWSVIVAAMAAFLHRMSGKTDIILNFPIHGRITAGARKTPGMLANVLPLRLNVQPSMSFSELIRQGTDVFMKSMRHQRYRYEDMRRDLGHRRDPGGWWPVINVLDFDYEMVFGDALAVAHPQAPGVTYDLSLILYGKNDGRGIRVDFVANATRYRAEELAGHHESFLRHLSALLAAPGTSIGESFRQDQVAGPPRRGRS